MFAALRDELERGESEREQCVWRERRAEERAVCWVKVRGEKGERVESGREQCCVMMCVCCCAGECMSPARGRGEGGEWQRAVCLVKEESGEGESCMLLCLCCCAALREESGAG